MLALGLTAGCSGDDAAATRPLYVAVGASDSVGVGADDPEEEAWPRVFRRDALGGDWRFRNVATSGATVASALEKQVPVAVDAAPQLVTVWLVVNDIRAGVDATTYEQQLGRLVHALRRDGATTVLVGNVPRVPWFPAELITPYNEAIARVVAAEEAVLVDLHARSSTFDLSHLAADFFHPSTAGHAVLAAAFADTYEPVAKRPAMNISLAS